MKKGKGKKLRDDVRAARRRMYMREYFPEGYSSPRYLTAVARLNAKGGRPPYTFYQVLREVKDQEKHIQSHKMHDSDTSRFFRVLTKGKGKDLGLRENSFIQCRLLEIAGGDEELAEALRVVVISEFEDEDARERKRIG